MSKPRIVEYNSLLNQATDELIDRVRGITNKQYLLSASSNDPHFNFDVVHAKLPIGVDHTLKRRTIRIPVTGSADFGSTVNFTLNGARMDYITRLTLVWKVSAITGGPVSAYWAYGSEFFETILFTVLGTQVSLIKSKSIMLKKLTEDTYEEYLKSYKLLENSHTDVGTGGTPAEVTFYLDLMPFLFGEQPFPVSNQLNPGQKQIELAVKQKSDVCASGGTAITAGGDITTMYLIQEGVVDTEKLYINQDKAIIDSGKKLIYGYTHYDSRSVTATSTTFDDELNFNNRLNVEKLYFGVLDSTATTAYTYDPNQKFNTITDFQISHANTPYYPDESNRETSDENLYFKRMYSYANARPIYKAVFGLDKIDEKKMQKEYDISVSNIGLNVSSQSKLNLSINGGIASGDKLYIVIASQRGFIYGKDYVETTES